MATAAAKILGDYDGERSQELLTSLLSIFFVTKKSLFQFEVIQDLLASKMMMASSVFTKKFAEGTINMRITCSLCISICWVESKLVKLVVPASV